MDQQHIATLIAERKWIPLSAIAIWIVVRLLKSDTKLPFDVPGTWRAPLAGALGIVAGVLEMVATGTAWHIAIVDGLLAAAIAAYGHDVIIGSVRGGKEIPVPFLMREGTRPAPGKPVTVDAETPLPVANEERRD